MAIVSNSRVLCVISLLIAVCLVSFPALAQYGGGMGEPNDPYLIYTAEQMNAVGTEPNDWDKHFKLMADIDLSSYTGTDFNIIGASGNAFTGVFNGNGHTISNFSYISTDTNSIGLFGYIYDPNSQVKDLGLIAPNIDAVAGYVGSLVGYLIEGTISNCYVEGGNVAGGGDMFGAGIVGGLVGWNVYGLITNCHASGGVSGTWQVGGLVGDNDFGTITNCYVRGDVSGTMIVGGLVGTDSGTITCSYARGTVSGTTDVGGLVGAESGTITCSYASSTVSGTTNIGGLVGDNSLSGIIFNCYSSGDVSASGAEGYPSFSGGLAGGNQGTITNCYSSGSVSASGTEEYPDGDSGGGGLVGLEGLLWGGGEVINSFWDIQTSGQTTSGGGKGRTTVQMQRASTFYGWDENGNEGIWTIDEGNDYPRLWWENKPGEALDRQHLSDFLTGTGTEDDPYLIYTAEQMNKIGLYEEDWDKHFKLMADIDLSAYTGTDFNIIGYFVDWDDNKLFTGVFDGNGKKISNFSYTSTGADNIGLFGCVYWEAEIRDLGLIDPNVDAGTGSGSGLLVGSFSWGTISNCYVEGGSVSGNNYVGGLVGENYMGTITNCASSASVSGNEGIGGLVGYNRSELLVGSGSITMSYSTGTVSGSRQVGGLVGENEGAITNCYSTGSVSGDGTIGGLVGSHFWGIITNCYSSGGVSGNEFGGLVGMDLGGVTNSFWDIQTSGQKWSFEGTGKTTVEMQTATTFLEAGWDFVDETANGPEDIWWINEGQDYPRLWWERDDLFLVVDDFESYNDLDLDDPNSNRIYLTWVDGYDNPSTNGSVVGCVGTAPVCWPRVHSGIQSMPLIYNNGVGISEATANIDNLEIGRDWTIEGVGILSLWFHGLLRNAAEPMYVALGNDDGTTGVSYNDNPNAAQIEKWTEWRIDLQEFANQGVDLSDIETISIGFGDKNNPQAGGSGHVKFDDIRLYPSAQ